MSETPYQAISKAVTEGEDLTAGQLVREALDAGCPPLEILQQGVVPGITKAGDLWKANQFFMPDVILAADAFKAGMAPLKPLLTGGAGSRCGKFVIGVVEGDMHDLGKGLVGAMLTSAGFDVIDLGINVPMSDFIASTRSCHGSG